MPVFPKDMTDNEAAVLQSKANVQHTQVPLLSHLRCRVAKGFALYQHSTVLNFPIFYYKYITYSGHWNITKNMNPVQENARDLGRDEMPHEVNW